MKKSSIDQMVKFLERKEAKEKCRYALQVRHLEDTQYVQHTLRTLRMVLTEARRLQVEERTAVKSKGA